MNQLQRAAAIIGSILLGASLFLLARNEEQTAPRRRRRTEGEAPVEELAEHLKEAWAGYHTR